MELRTLYFVHMLPCLSLQATCLLVYSFTCPLTMLPCLWYKQLVYSFTCLLVHLLCYPVFDTSNSFTCLLVHLSTYLVTLSFFTSNSFTCLLGHSSTNLVTLSPFASNLSTRSLVHSSTNCLFLLNIKVNISIISIWVVWSIGVIRPILKKEYEERCKWLFVKELWKEGCKAFNHSKTVIA